MAPIQTHAVIQHGLSLRLVLVAAVSQPAVRLQQHRRSEVFFAVPPVGGAGGGAAGAEDAFVEAVQLFPVRGRLAVLEAVFGLGLALEVGLDGFVLFVELGQVGDEVLDDVGVGEGVDAALLGCVCGDAACLKCH